ncbi:MAG: DUF4230 domain-containing protein [Chitinophagales bacterium]
MIRQTALLISVLLIFVMGGLAGWYVFAPKSVTQEESQIMLERIRSVMKLVTVEGNYTEVYTHSDYSGFFTYFWDKKMIMRVTATVSAGYDLEQVKMEVDGKARLLRIGPMPAPSILSIDHKIDYYDISEGVFTSFSPSDYNQINEKAKELIRQKAQVQLLPAAREQASKTFDLLRSMLEGAGWKLELVEENRLFR